jgi:hypothetical protein
MLPQPSEVLRVAVSGFGGLSEASDNPPGTSKWNWIEHQLFSFIGTNWRGKPLESHEVIINLINATTTNTGLKAYARLDTSAYPKGVEVTDAQLAAVNIHRHDFRGEWNYTIKPSVIEM